MLDMGFIRDIRKVLALLPAQRQNLLFSATFSNEIRALASGLLHDPASVQVDARNAPSELVEQRVIRVDRERKRELLSHLVKTGVIYQALVFTRTKHGANRLAKQLEQDGIPTTAIHGNKSQPQRVRALADFKANRYAILVATEVAARGLDIDALPHVVNFELPMVPEDYVHRIGRTGRAGVDGEAVSLVCIDEERMLRDIERVLGRSIPSEVIPGFEPDPRIRPEPILRGGLGGARPGAGPRVPRPQHPSHAPRSASRTRGVRGSRSPVVRQRVTHRVRSRLTPRVRSRATDLARATVADPVRPLARTNRASRLVSGRRRGVARGRERGPANGQRPRHDAGRHGGPNLGAPTALPGERFARSGRPRPD